MKSHYINTVWSKIWSRQYGDTEWLCLKVSFAIWYYLQATAMLFQYASAPYPSGILSFSGTYYLMLVPVKIAIAIILFALMALYVLEIRIALVTLVIFVLSIFIFAIGESNGVMGRDGLMSLTWVGQSLAYMLYNAGSAPDLRRNRFQFPLQAIAAVYTLAAISKLVASPLHWVSDSPYLTLQIIKSFDYAYYTSGDPSLHAAGIARAQFILQHPQLTKLLLAGSLLLELCAFVLLTGRRPALIYALLLLSMHLGITYFMNIFFPHISIPTLLFAVNPLYIVIVPFLGRRKTAATRAHSQ
ncbi:MAG: hypothetical protein JST83_13815 [Bacteroidetes bacterium]|nr:hypothetical protein [Bacteroidota bacterium]